MSTRVYLAGKIQKNCWRHVLVPGLRDRTWHDGPIKTDRFVYVGPFFTGCDHGCNHGSHTHGVGGLEAACTVQVERRAIIERCLSGVRSADVVLAYIEREDCYGTISEIEHAFDFGRQVVIAFAPGMNFRDYWFLTERAHQVVVDVTKAGLPALLSEVLCRSGEHAN